jgi:ubiquinone/menaquinone biosynthesis C-methylase UbiE
MRHRDAVRRYFDRDAPRYSQERYTQRSVEQLSYVMRRQVALEMVGRGPGRALDIGSGPGVLTSELEARRFKVVCADLSIEMLLRVRQRADASDVSWLVQADAEQLPFADESFDRVVSLGVVPYLSDLEAGLQEIQRVLRPAGIAVLQASSRWSPTRALHNDFLRPAYLRLHSIASGIPDTGRGFRLRTHGIAEFRRLVAKHGLRVEGSVSYDFRPPLCEWFAPAATRWITARLQVLARSASLSWLGQGFLVKAVK